MRKGTQVWVSGKELRKTTDPSVKEWGTLCYLLTSSELSEGVTAESGPSVVVWELSLMGEEAWVPSFRSMAGSDGTALIWLELWLKMSSSSPSVAALVRSQPDRSTASACSGCWDRGCSVMMSWPTDPGVETPEEAANSPPISLFTEAEHTETPFVKWPKETVTRESKVCKITQSSLYSSVLTANSLKLQWKCKLVAQQYILQTRHSTCINKQVFLNAMNILQCCFTSKTKVQVLKQLLQPWL
jgi:hypothetical protein